MIQKREREKREGEREKVGEKREESGGRGIGGEDGRKEKEEVEGLEQRGR